MEHPDTARQTGHHDTIRRMAAQKIAVADILQHLTDDCGVPAEQAQKEIAAVLGDDSLPRQTQAAGAATRDGEQPLHWAGWLILLAVLGLTLVTGIPQATIAVAGQSVDAEVSTPEAGTERWLRALDGSGSEQREYRFSIGEHQLTGRISAQPGSLGNEDLPSMVVYYVPAHPEWHSPDNGFPWWRTALLPLLGWIIWRELRLRRQARGV